MAGPILAQGRTTILRRLVPTDLAPFLSYRSDFAVARYQDWNRMDEAQARQFLAAVSEAPLFQPGAWCQVAVATADEALIGDMGLFLAEDGGSVTLGITLARAAWGRGHATEAMRLAMGLAFRRPSVRHVRAGCDARNAASLKLLRRLGMTEIGSKPFEEHGAAQIERQFQITRAQFAKTPPRA